MTFDFKVVPSVTTPGIAYLMKWNEATGKVDVTKITNLYRRTPMLYEVAVLLKPTGDQKNAGEPEQILLPVTQILAKGDEEARMRAVLEARATAQESPALIDTALDRVQVLVRPFE
jgi:hypothetical protein